MTPRRPVNWVGYGAALSGGLAFVLSWIPFFGIGLGDTWGFVALVLGIWGLVRPGSKAPALGGLALALLTLFLKSTPILRWL
jgi:hypothetical protein